ncbi:MAG: hypothetical protein LBN21_06290 [Treponema sp.]|nr:hypothetical protein [Treponema sp.]
MTKIFTVSRGEVTGIGKLKVFPKSSFPYEIPMLSFLVVKINSDAYVSTCIQLQVDGYGEDPEKAREDMRENCIEFLHENFSNPKAREKCWENLHTLFAGSSQELWVAYRTVQLDLAEQGVSTDITSFLIDRIADLEQQIAVLKAVKEKTANGDTSFEAKIVDYRATA